MPGSLVLIDYGMGNLRSVQKKLNQMGLACTIGSTPEAVAAASKLILPGVGHFANGVAKLKSMNLWDAIDRKVKIENTPILGICLGMQLMTKHSEEGDMEGFGWIDATVQRFRVENKIRYKVPHIGWNQALSYKENVLFRDIPDEALFYFVHAYHVVCNEPEDKLAGTIYEYEFTSAFQKDHIFGVQFHPEKSHEAGEQLFRNFINSGN
jgi:glutamine amidotransferase